jgi:acetylornithine deacetylase/succinyl-diaminopimelate desuccinylase-like protein
MTDVEALRSAIGSLMPGLVKDLSRLVRIDSVSADGFDREAVRRSAETVADVLAFSGLDVSVLDVEGGHPAVLGRIPPPAGAPTALLYAHHDVQPPGPVELWSTPPFEPIERDGRLFGRGAADDKAGVVAHAAAVRAWNGRPPIGVTVFVEGEEESGSAHLPELLARHHDDLRADAVVLADSSNWRLGVPALTTSLRGVAGCVIEVRTLDHAVHSGMYGGPVPDALIALVRTLASLHDDEGRVAVPGLVTEAADPLDLSEEELRGYAGVRPGVRLIGAGSLTERMWTRPAISILAIDAPRVTEASPQLVPSARALVSMRVAPGEDVHRALAALTAHLKRNTPWGAEITVTESHTGEPFRVAADGPIHDAVRRAFADAWGTRPVDMGAGGSIPFVKAFAEAFPDAAILITGVEDPSSGAHSENESLHLGEFERACLAEALFLGYLGEASKPG